MSYGTLDKKYISTVAFLDRREIYQYALDITREKESFVDLMEMLDRSVATDVPSYHNFSNKELFDNITSTSASDTSGGTDGSRWDVVVSAGDYALVAAGALIICPNKAVGYVREKKASNTLDVIAVEGDGGGTDLELTAGGGDIFAVFSQASGEGSDGPAEGRRQDLVKNQNHVMIVKDAVKVTDIQRSSKVEVEFNDEPYYFIKHQHDALMRFKAKVSMAMLFSRYSDENFSSSTPSLTDTSSNPVNTTRGLNQYIEESGITLNATDAVSLATYAALERQFSRERCPDDYLVLMGSEGSIAHTDAFGALTNSSVFSPGARLEVDGKQLDINVTKLNLYDRTYTLKRLPIQDHKTLFNFTGSAGFEKRMWYVPNDKIRADVGGEEVDRMRIRYLEDHGDGAFDHRYREVLTGGLAPIPTNDSSYLKITYESRQGLEVFGPEHFALIDLP